MVRESTSGTSIPHDSPAAKARPLTLGLAAASVTAGFLSQDPAEAAHVQSRSRTEPIRCDCRPRVPSRSRFLGNAPGNRASPFGIELAVLLGLPVARRGFWDAAFPIPPGGKETMPSLHGNMH